MVIWMIFGSGSWTICCGLLQARLSSSLQHDYYPGISNRELEQSLST